MPIQIIPIQAEVQSKDSVVIANVATQKLEEESLWDKAGTDLTVGSTVPYRSGSWSSKFVLTDMDVPPFVEWAYTPSADTDTTPVIQLAANRAILRVSNIDLIPDPKDVSPDSLWEVNGLDLIPR